MRVLVAAILVGSLFSIACDSCDRRDTKRKSVRQSQRTEESPSEMEGECSQAADCIDDDPCTIEACEKGECVASLSPPGTSCDDGNVCNGVATCDRDGRCVAGAPPTDDGNACTIDTCDPATGVSHQPIAVDDGDACTADACDPRTGTLTHYSIKVDDGDDCTIDSCDPRAGVKHEPASPTYTCQPICGEGFHSASRTPSPECGAPEGLRTFCMPNCGASFYTCDASCPKGYEKRSETKGRCGPTSTMLFCVKA